MTDFNIEIIEQPSYSLEVAVGASGTDVPSIEIVTSGGIYLEISNRDRILASDLPDTYPISSTTGLLPISRVSGLYAGSGIIFSSGIDGSITIQGQTQNINITGTSGISVIQSGGSYIIYTTGNFGLTSSQIQSLLNNGVSISVTGGTGNFNSLSVNSVPVSTSGHSHLSSSITDFNSATSGLLTPYALLNSGNFITLLVTGTPVSLSGHIHNSSQITDFNSSVSGLLPFTGILGSGYVTLSSLNRTLTIGVSGLQPSGNYSVNGHQHVVADITNFNSGVSGLLPSISGGNYISILPSGNSYILSATGLQPSGNYSVSGHTHISSQITDFNSSVSSLIPVKNVVGSGYVNTVSTTGLFTISVTGLQPSGNYSLSGHTHIASNITDFNSATSGLLTPYAQLSSGNFTKLYVTGVPVSVSGHIHSVSDIINFNTEVSGLIPVRDILSGSGIQIGVNSGVYTVTAYGVAASSASSLITRCENRTGSTLPKMTVVYINGGHGNRPTIQKSIASSEAGSSKTYGVTASQINDNSAGDVVVFGALIDVDTNQFGAVEGSTLYLSPSVSGNLTATKPTAPNHMVAVGKIVRNHNNQGIIEVSIQNGFELEELHNVATTGAVSGQFLKYNGGLWRNTGILSSDISDFSSTVSGLLPVRDIIAGTGIAISNIGGVFTINSSGSTGSESSNVAISNSGVGRLLASDGTSSGIIGQSNLTFIDNNLAVNGVIINNGNNLYMWSNFR